VCFGGTKGYVGGTLGSTRGYYGGVRGTQGHLGVLEGCAMGDFLYVTRCVRVLTGYSRGYSVELRGTHRSQTCGRVCGPAATGGVGARGAAGATWTSRTATAGWAARYAHTSVIAAGAIYVIGGQGTDYLQDVWASTDGGARGRTASGGRAGFWGYVGITSGHYRGSLV
jgi:hypothetical protein